ncbi:ABC transporter permease [Agrococcus jejuensis]|uniref:ABC-2 type transport system permease protein n=1 Tax=Agrococcus jejuensis TaxID=399736 RepID=A0A1G8HA50_9MICO|nr:ABC transporter permease [Agrococcus jejuensis]SDI03370.1 ABC-2 type transport system permease protein [Agrococcus jejuensis]
MTVTTGSLPATLSPAGLARTIRIALGRVGYEVRTYFRQLDQVFFTFLFPVLMLGIFASVFDTMTFPDGRGGTTDIAAAEYYLPAMLASGILLSGVQNLGVDVAVARTNGTLKRLAGTPMPPVAFLVGKLGQAFVTGLAQAVVLLGVGAIVFRVGLPTDAGSWATFAWVFVLGTITSALLGVALSRVPRSGRSATAVIIPIVLVVQFASGIFIQFSLLPEWMQQAAQALPVAWMALGMRAALLPDAYAMLEVGETWNLAGVALALGIWLVVGLVAVRLTFRWIRRS